MTIILLDRMSCTVMMYCKRMFIGLSWISKGMFGVSLTFTVRFFLITVWILLVIMLLKFWCHDWEIFPAVPTLDVWYFVFWFREHCWKLCEENLGKSFNWVHIEFILLLCYTYTVFQKKVCHYIFGNNFNKNCPIAIIFGVLITQTIGHRKIVSFSPPHLVCATIVHWKTQNTKIHIFRSMQHVILRETKIG